MSVADKVKDIIVEKLGVERSAVVDPDEEAEKIKTVADAISYVESHAKA